MVRHETRGSFAGPRMLYGRAGTFENSDIALSSVATPLGGSGEDLLRPDREVRVDEHPGIAVALREHQQFATDLFGLLDLPVELIEAVKAAQDREFLAHAKVVRALEEFTAPT